MATAKKETPETNAFDSMMSVNPEAFKQGYEKFAEGMSAVADFNKSSLEAMMTSTGAFAKGVEKITAAQTEFAKSSFENGVAAAKSIACSCS